MKQILDAMLQIVTLIMGGICFVLSTFKDETLEYLAIAMALVCVSVLFARVQDKEDKR